MENFNCSCGAVLDKNNLFCASCGKKVEQPLPANTCYNCKIELPPNAKFCSKCGAKQEMQTQNKVETPQQNLEQTPVLNVNDNAQTDNNTLSDLLPNENVDSGATTLLSEEEFDNYQQNVDDKVNVVADSGATTLLSEEEFDNYQQNVDDKVNVVADSGATTLLSEEEFDNYQQNVDDKVNVVADSSETTLLSEDEYNQYQTQSQAETTYEPPVEQIPNIEEISPAQQEQQSQQEQLDENNSNIENENVFVEAENKGGKGVRFFKAFVSVILCIMIFVLALGTQVLFMIRSTFNEENIKEAVNEIDVSEINVPEEVIEQTELAGFEMSDDQTITEYIFAITDPDLIDDYDITKKKIEKTLNDKVVKDFLADKIYLFADDVFNETDEGEISKKDITSFIKKNSSKFENIIGYSIDDNDIDKISTFLDDNNIIEKISISYIREEAPKPMGIIKFIFSYLLIGLICVIVILSIIAIFAINKKRVDSALYYIGSSAICCGVVVAILGILSNSVNNIIKSFVGEPFVLIKPVTEIIYSKFIFTGLITLGIGIIFIITSILISKFSKNKV